MSSGPPVVVTPQVKDRLPSRRAPSISACRAGALAASVAARPIGAAGAATVGAAEDAGLPERPVQAVTRLRISSRLHGPVAIVFSFLAAASWSRVYRLPWPRGAGGPPPHSF